MTHQVEYDDLIFALGQIRTLTGLGYGPQLEELPDAIKARIDALKWERDEDHASLALTRRSRDLYANKYVDERARAESAESQRDAACALLRTSVRLLSTSVHRDAIEAFLEGMGK